MKQWLPKVKNPRDGCDGAAVREKHPTHPLGATVLLSIGYSDTAETGFRDLNSRESYNADSPAILSGLSVTTLTVIGHGGPAQTDFAERL